MTLRQWQSPSQLVLYKDDDVSLGRKISIEVKRIMRDVKVKSLSQA